MDNICFSMFCCQLCWHDQSGFREIIKLLIMSTPAISVPSELPTFANITIAIAFKKRFKKTVNVKYIIGHTVYIINCQLPDCSFGKTSKLTTCPKWIFLLDNVGDISVFPCLWILKIFILLRISIQTMSGKRLSIV